MDKDLSPGIPDELLALESLGPSGGLTDLLGPEIANRNTHMKNADVGRITYSLARTKTAEI